MGKTIVFLHPDLGIGGAERLVIDAAMALITKGHIVSFVTTHHDPSHCFAETKDGSFPVTVVGDWIPRNIFGKCYALCAYIRMIYAALFVVLFYNVNPDVIFCDIVSACIPVLKCSRSFVVFYCHFPDRLLSKTGGKLKNLYRLPLNWLEEKTTNCADAILVNSEFTRTVFTKTFSTIHKIPDILYPSINTELLNYKCTVTLKEVLGEDVESKQFIFLSINRYERKKNIPMAIAALRLLKEQLNDNEWRNIYLIIAGGFDNQVLENNQHYEELIDHAKNNEVQDKVFFLKSPSDAEKLLLLKRCNCLLYTPSNEHFGIVPLEAMYFQKPVIAVNSGGPKETVVHKETGFLCSPTKEDFSSAMAYCVRNIELINIMGIKGKNRFEERFSFSAFKENLNQVIENMSLGTAQKIN